MPSTATGVFGGQLHCCKKQLLSGYDAVHCCRCEQVLAPGGMTKLNVQGIAVGAITGAAFADLTNVHSAALCAVTVYECTSSIA